MIPGDTSQYQLKVNFTLKEIKLNFLAVIILCNTGLVTSYQFQLLSNVISECMLKKSDSYKTPQKVIIERRNVRSFWCPSFKCTAWEWTRLKAGKWKLHWGLSQPQQLSWALSSLSLSHSTPPPLSPLALLSDVVNFIHMEWSRPVPSPIKLPWGCNLRMIVLS